MNKPRVVKDYEKLEESIQEQIKLNYPYGFDRYLITFKNSKNKFVSALPFETEDRHFLVRMSKETAREIVLQDDDYNENGHLRTSVKEEYQDKYEDNDEDNDEDVDEEFDGEGEDMSEEDED